MTSRVCGVPLQHQILHCHSTTLHPCRYMLFAALGRSQAVFLHFQPSRETLQLSWPLLITANTNPNDQDVTDTDAAGLVPLIFGSAIILESLPVGIPVQSY